MTLTLALLSCFQAVADTHTDSVFVKIKNQIEANLRYPTKALALNQTGTAVFRVTFDRSGNILKADMLYKTGYVALDAEATDVFRRISKFDINVPDDLYPGVDDFVVQLPITFELSRPSVASTGGSHEGVPSI